MFWNFTKHKAGTGCILVTGVPARMGLKKSVCPTIWNTLRKSSPVSRNLKKRKVTELLNLLQRQKDRQKAINLSFQQMYELSQKLLDWEHEWIWIQQLLASYPDCIQKQDKHVKVNLADGYQLL